jgi:hypothetical protein
MSARNRCSAYVLLIVLAGLGTFAQSESQPAPANPPCTVPVDAHWTAQEQFVWGRACAGRVADFNSAEGYGGHLDPKRPAGLPANRVLRPEFIKSILLDDPYRQVLVHSGLRIDGALFMSEIVLRNADLASELWLDHSLLEKGADFTALRSTRRITLDGSKIKGRLNMVGLRIEGDLSMHDSQLHEVSLGNGDVGGTLNLSGSKTTATLDFPALHVGRDLFMDKTEGFGANMPFARIDRLLILSGSKFTGELSMPFIRIGELLAMDNADFNVVILGAARVSGQMALSRSKFRGALNLTALELTGNLAMGDKAEFTEVHLQNAHLRGHLALDGASVRGKLDMSNLQLDGNLDLSNKALLFEVDLYTARIGGFVALSGSKVTGGLNMSELQLNGSLFGEGTELQSVDLTGARVGGSVNLRHSKVTGSLNAEFLDVRGAMFLGRGAEFSGPLDLVFSHMDELELLSSTFHHDVDITGAQIRHDLVLGAPDLPPPGWSESALILRNATLDAIQDSPNAWPKKLDLNGFTYRSLGGIHEGEGDRMLDRPVRWFKGWLAKGRYSPQPYEQLAGKLQSEGRPDAAAEIRYTSKQYETAQAGFARRVWLTALDWFIGYGYHIERALIWVAGFLIAGIAVLRISGEGRRNGMPFGIAYSFDMLLPIVRLREKHYEIDLKSWARYYFYAHKIMGYVLASFLIAGLSGLVK